MPSLLARASDAITQRRSSIHHAAANPDGSTSALNNTALDIAEGKPASVHVETSYISQQDRIPIQVKKPSFKMDHILHMKKESRRSNSKDRDGKKEKRSSSIIGSISTPKDRPSLTSRPSGGSPSLRPLRAGKFEMIMESPPAILHGSTSYSSGALLSGRLKFDVTDPSGECKLEKFEMELQVTTTTKKPIVKDCKECSSRVEVLKKWTFLSEPKTFLKNLDNQFPWSYLLSGRFPATTYSTNGSIEYALHVKAKTLTGEAITFIHPLKVDRALPVGADKASIRVFPPTNLTGRVVMPPVVHPIGTFPVQMTLSGVVERRESSSTRWRLKKLMWKIEETSKIRSVPCGKHKSKVADGKAVQNVDVKLLGNDDMKQGWKTDFDTAGGEIALEFEAQLTTKSSHKVTCDVESQSGLEVKHMMILELIVAEEFVPNKNSNLITPTGAARVLRMQFPLLVSDRAGMGISWDDEMPPMYEDVPPSPPGYGGKTKREDATIEDYHGPDFESEDLERLPTANPADPPIYREKEFSSVNLHTMSRVMLSREARRIEDDGEAGPSRTRQYFAEDRRLPALSLDELEADAPDYRIGQRPPSPDVNAEAEIDFGMGETGDHEDDMMEMRRSVRH